MPRRLSPLRVAEDFSPAKTLAPRLWPLASLGAEASAEAARPSYTPVNHASFAL